jgi:hypothetical protein
MKVILVSHKFRHNYFIISKTIFPNLCNNITNTHHSHGTRNMQLSDNEDLYLFLLW